MADKRKCIHKSIINEKTIAVCKLCGLVLTSSVKPIIPKKYQCKFETNQSETLEIMRTQKIEYNDKILIDYLPKRLDLIKYLRSLCKKLNLKEQTYYSALLYADSILSNNKDINNDLLIISCLLLSSKFNEEELDVPVLSDFKVRNKNLYYTPNEIKRYETISLKLMKYKLNYFSAFDYLEFFLVNGILFEKEITPKSLPNSNVMIIDIVEAAYQLCYNILNFFVVDVRFPEFKLEHIVLSIICIVREHFKIIPVWNSNFVKQYNVKFDEIEECYNVISKLFHKNQNTSLETLTVQKHKESLSTLSHRDKTITLIQSNEIKQISNKTISEFNKYANLYSTSEEKNNNKLPIYKKIMSKNNTKNKINSKDKKISEEKGNKKSENSSDNNNKGEKGSKKQVLLEKKSSQNTTSTISTNTSVIRSSKMSSVIYDTQDMNLLNNSMIVDDSQKGFDNYKNKYVSTETSIVNNYNKKRLNRCESNFNTSVNFFKKMNIPTGTSNNMFKKNPILENKNTKLADNYLKYLSNFPSKK